MAHLEQRSQHLQRLQRTLISLCSSLQDLVGRWGQARGEVCPQRKQWSQNFQGGQCMVQTEPGQCRQTPPSCVCPTCLLLCHSLGLHNQPLCGTWDRHCPLTREPAFPQLVQVAAGPGLQSSSLQSRCSSPQPPLPTTQTPTEQDLSTRQTRAETTHSRAMGEAETSQNRVRPEGAPLCALRVRAGPHCFSLEGACISLRQARTGQGGRPVQHPAGSGWTRDNCWISPREEKLGLC